MEQVRAEALGTGATGRIPVLFQLSVRAGSSPMIKADNKVSFLTQVSGCGRFYCLLSGSC